MRLGSIVVVFLEDLEITGIEARVKSHNLRMNPLIDLNTGMSKPLFHLIALDFHAYLSSSKQSHVLAAWGDWSGVYHWHVGSCISSFVGCRMKRLHDSCYSWKVTVCIELENLPNRCSK